MSLPQKLTIVRELKQLGLSAAFVDSVESFVALSALILGFYLGCRPATSRWQEERREASLTEGCPPLSVRRSLRAL